MCERYGVDPAAFISDDYLAFQLRLALFWTNQPVDPDGPSEQERALTDEMKAVVNG